ncbi:helix-turn-helix domain-containing protein [Solobacterium moorei]|nr:helix-turn-helix transcriptional regulator [Solobacterium moorei]
MKYKFNNMNIKGAKMKVNYNGLWKLLIDKNMNKKNLKEKLGIAPATIAKMGKGEFVSMEILYRICVALNTDFGELISVSRSITDDEQ